MFAWEKFWCVQSIVAYCSSSLLISNTFLSFPWSWLAALTSANLLGVKRGGRKLFTSLLYEIPLLAFLQLGCFYAGKMSIVIVAEGSNAASIIFALLACWRYGYAPEEVFGNRALLERAVCAFGYGWLWRLLNVFFADGVWWRLEMVIRVFTGASVLQCGVAFNRIYTSLEIQRLRLKIQRLRLELEQMIGARVEADTSWAWL